MRSRLLLEIVFSFLLNAFAIGAVFSDQDLIFNGAALSDPMESTSLVNLDDWPQDMATLDTSQLLASGENSEEFVFGPSLDMDLASFDLVDCTGSTIEDVSIFSKSRVRRFDVSNGASCLDPSLQPSSPLTGQGMDFGPMQERLRRILDAQPGAIGLLQQALRIPGQNPLCYVVTLGVLPWGICSSGDPADEDPTTMTPMSINGVIQVIAYSLTHCTKGTYLQLNAETESCRFNSIFNPITDNQPLIWFGLFSGLPFAITCPNPGSRMYCCLSYDFDTARICLPLEDIQADS